MDKLFTKKSTKTCPASPSVVLASKYRQQSPCHSTRTPRQCWRRLWTPHMGLQLQSLDTYVRTCTWSILSDSCWSPHIPTHIPSRPSELRSPRLVTEKPNLPYREVPCKITGFVVLSVPYNISKMWNPAPTSTKIKTGSELKITVVTGQFLSQAILATHYSGNKI